MNKTLGWLLLLASPASAQVSEFRIGHMIKWLFDVLGFNFLDFIADTPFFIFFIFLIFFIGAVLAVLWIKKRY